MLFKSSYYARGLHVPMRVVVSVRELRHEQVGHEDRGQEDEDAERHGHDEGDLLHLLHHASGVDPARES